LFYPADYAGVSLYAIKDDYLFKSNDEGKTWVDATGSLSATGGLISMTDPRRVPVYVSTYTGVYVLSAGLP
jgi:hypothetical protein